MHFDGPLLPEVPVRTLLQLATGDQIGAIRMGVTADEPSAAPSAFSGPIPPVTMSTGEQPLLA